jgi:hypothetical protein
MKMLEIPPQILVPIKMPAFITNRTAIPPGFELPHNLPPLDTRYIINTEEKSTSAPYRGHGERDPPRQFFLNLTLE